MHNYKSNQSSPNKSNKFTYSQKSDDNKYFEIFETLFISNIGDLLLHELFPTQHFDHSVSCNDLQNSFCSRISVIIEFLNHASLQSGKQRTPQHN